MKLTRDHKSAIIREAVDAVFQERNAALANESNRLAEIIYEKHYTPVLRKKMNELPEEFFHQRSEMHFRIGKGSTESCRLSSTRKVGGVHSQWPGVCLKLEDNDSLAPQFVEFTKQVSFLENQKSTLIAELSKFLAPITTLNKLKEVWPEGLPYYKELLTAPTKNVPAVQSDAINEMIERMKEPIPAPRSFES